MFLAGDEFGNTQFGNNNAYCQDNITSWLDWRLLDRNRDIFNFFKYMIRFRKEHRILRTNISGGTCGFPDTSFHGVTPWQGEFHSYDHYVGVMFAGQDKNTGPQIIYVASNAYWEQMDVTLPELSFSMCWEIAVDTWEETQDAMPKRLSGSHVFVRPRSVMVFVGK